MGNLVSQHRSKSSDTEEDASPSSTSTPIITGGGEGGLIPPKNKASQGLLFDPRSPTVGVSRTPVEVPRQGQDKTNRLQPLDTNTNNSSSGEGGISTPGGFMDPRSPAFDYKRTPITLVGEGGNDGGEVDENGDGNSGGGGANQLQVAPIINTNMIPAPNDLRKRLFVSQLNDSIHAENKEN